MGRKTWKMPKEKQRLFDRVERHTSVYHELILVRRKAGDVLRCVPCARDLISGADDVISLVCFTLDAMGQSVSDQR